MGLPIISKDTIESFQHDLEGDNPSLNPSAILKRLKEDNPQLALAIIALAQADMHMVGRMLYVCELIDRQLESIQLEDML